MSTRSMDEKNDLSNAEMGGVDDIRQTHSNVSVTLAAGSDQLHRGMKSRHIQFMALGGA